MIKKITTLIALSFTLMGLAQKNSSSPYSFFGIGEPAAHKSVEEIAMGKIGGVLNSPYQLSFTNPASYGSLLWTTYVFSLGNRMVNYDDGNMSQTSSHAGFTYLSLGIPIRGNQGLSFGLELNTAVGYSLLDLNEDDEGTVVESTHYTGLGGTNRFFMGYGYKSSFGLSIGAEAAYIFGGIENSILNRRLGVQLATKHYVDSYVKGLEFKTGAIYEHTLKNDIKAKIGAAFTLSNELTDKGDEYLFSLENTGEPGARIADTLYAKNYKSVLTYPLKSVISVGVGKELKWFVGAEYTLRDAISLEGSFFEDQDVYEYTSSSMFSVGGSFTPKFNSLKNYFERITYRSGFYYIENGLMIHNVPIKDYGISFGVSLPVSLNISNLNLGVELGKRGSTEQNLLEEKYFNFRLSLSLNDKWFRKRTLN